MHSSTTSVDAFPDHGIYNERSELGGWAPATTSLITNGIWIKNFRKRKDLKKKKVCFYI